MFTPEQQEIIQRINNELKQLIEESRLCAMPSAALLDSYRRDLTLLCSKKYFSPGVLNVAMDVMHQLMCEREKNDRAGLAIIAAHTYERFRIRPENSEKD